MDWKKLLQSLGEARDAKIGAVGAQQVRDLYDTDPELAKETNQKYLKANVTGILSAPMAGEFATYGLIGGGARLLGGTAGSTVGSLGLGALGDVTDKKLNTNFLGDTGRLLGGLAGFGAGMKATTPLLRTAATKGITLHMPDETFMKLRGEGFHKKYSKLSDKPLLNPEKPSRKYIEDWTEDIADANPEIVKSEFDSKDFITNLLKDKSEQFDSSLPEVERINKLKQVIQDLDGSDEFSVNLKKNFASNINDLARNNTYHKSLTFDDIVKELPKMAMPERGLNQDISPVLDFFKKDALPRLLSNLKDEGVKLNIDDIDFITDLYSNPLKGVDIKFGYTGPGTGGYSLGENFIRFKQNPSGKIGLGTLSHELHHSLRARLSKYLTKNGLTDSSWNIGDETLRSGSAVRNLQAFGEYTPGELRSMKPLAMSSRYRADKTPTSEIGAVTASNARFNVFMNLRDKLGRNPTLSEVNQHIDELVNSGKLTGLYERLPYGSQIGTLALENTKNTSYNINHKQLLLDTIKRARWNELPFYKKVFVKKPSPELWQGYNSYWQNYHDNVTRSIANAMKKIAGISGATYLGTKAVEQNEPETYKHGGILKAQKDSFENWYKTVPKSYNDTTNYNLRRAYELAPLNELEAWKNDPQKNHLRSVYLNNTGEYEFMKSPNHPTINKELEWFNSKDAEKFRKKYYLDSTSSPWKYKLK